MSSSSSTHSQLLQHLEAVARPRHLHWNRLGLLAVRSFVQECLAALGPVEEHGFDEGQGEGINLILRLPGQSDELEPLLLEGISTPLTGMPDGPGFPLPLQP